MREQSELVGGTVVLFTLWPAVVVGAWAVLMSRYWFGWRQW
jgi:hypothetical protein